MSGRKRSDDKGRNDDGIRRWKICGLVSFLDEHPDVYVTIQGDDRKYRKSVKVAYPAEENMGLKYHKINEMLANVHSSQVYDMIEQYGEMEYMMERSLQPWMEE